MDLIGGFCFDFAAKCVLLFVLILDWIWWETLKWNEMNKLIELKNADEFSERELPIFLFGLNKRKIEALLIKFTSMN